MCIRDRRKALFTDPQGSEQHLHENVLELQIAQHNATFDDQARDNVIFFVLVFLCFVRSFSKLRWCWWGRVESPRHCLLYTSDAADEEDSVDLGGCRIIKKKIEQYQIELE
eukprot:TRINITY_DN37057_c0_g1_i1.p1 TRINITY_DN37057_c0_g1~~TRINITY_DN37057_c0_g1_i1.p1  ORF type:complete len:111 (-),score=38.09 TRINITY_DN37057_c0_g1_i1:12-344(-)